MKTWADVAIELVHGGVVVVALFLWFKFISREND